MLIDRRSLPQHRPWIILAAIGTVLSIGWFVAERLLHGAWPGGSSLPGFTFGILGGLIILFEMLLWARKKKRVWRVGRAQSWMRAHIWLGLLTIPLLVCHSGLRWGGSLSASLLILLIVVVASGIFGLVVQNVIPKRMLDEIPAETIYSQIGHVSELSCRDAARLVRATCGPIDGEADEEADSDAGRADASRAFVTVGALRSSGKFQGKVLRTEVPAEPIPNSEALRITFRESVAPYLLHGKATGSPLQSRERAAAIFRELRSRLLPGAHPAVDALEGLCEQRRQLDRQAVLHAWLHTWLWIHLPLSVALMVLMFVHIYVALKYW